MRASLNILTDDDTMEALFAEACYAEEDRVFLRYAQTAELTEFFDRRRHKLLQGIEQQFRHFYEVRHMRAAYENTPFLDDAMLQDIAGFKEVIHEALGPLVAELRRVVESRS